MINILVASEDASRLAHLARLVGDAGRYRVTRTVGRAAQIVQRTDGLDAFDILMIDGVALDTAELAAIEKLSRLHPGLTCMLVSADASSQTLLEAMRAGVRDVLRWPLEPRPSGSTTTTGSSATSSHAVESSMSTLASGGFAAPGAGSACAWRSVLTGMAPGAPSAVAASFATSISTSG